MGQLTRKPNGQRQTATSAEVMRTIIATILAIIVAVSLNSLANQPPDEAQNNLEQSIAQTVDDAKVSALAVEKKADEPKLKWQDNPKKCDQSKQWIAKEPPFKCIKKTKTATSASNVATSRAGASAGGSGDCAVELAKYDWPHDVAHRVMIQESNNNPGTLNDNPATGDYSVGCFQINLYGANAASRPSEAWLKNATNNVSYAYGLWKGKGGSFMSDWKYTCYKVGCY